MLNVVKSQEEAQVSGHLNALRATIYDAEAALKRIYKGVSTGTLDPTEATLKSTTDELSEKRDRARDAVSRIRNNSLNDIVVNDTKILKFINHLSS